MHSTHSIVVLCCFAWASSACAYGSLDTGFESSAASVEDAGPTPTGHDPRDSGAHDANPATDAAPTLDASSPVDSAPPPDTGGQCTLSLGTGTVACDSCVSQSCCAEDNACGTDQNCMNMINCLNVCITPDGGAPPDPNVCMSQCGQQFPTGANEFNALNACLGTHCRVPCGGP